MECAEKLYGAVFVPNVKSRLIFNDYRNGHYCFVIYNVEQVKEERVLRRPVYAVARDGLFALTLDFYRQSYATSLWLQ